MTEILVVGGGVVGLSTAYWLGKAGHGVTVVERGPYRTRRRPPPTTTG